MNSFPLAILLCIAHRVFFTYALDPHDLVVTILSQREGYHAAQSYRMQDDLLDQARAMDKKPASVVLTHELEINGSWTIIPLLPYLSSEYPHAKWYFFCNENTVIRLGTLMDLLTSFNITQKLWIGHALYDRESTIIHHFAEHKKKFKYPNFASGFAMTASLVNSLAEEISIVGIPDVDFSIDASYEFATFVWNGGKGKRLTHAPELCVVSRSDCATYPRFFHPCGDPIPIEKIFVAVKTCSKYHTERVPVVKKTWARHAINIEYYSDRADEHLPNAHIVPNTERGHCAKTHAILTHANNILQSRNLDWLIITDDDTILSLGRLSRLLTCYNPAHSVALGERYGFRVYQNEKGYDYLTGGAGLALSAPLVDKIIESGLCNCPSPAAPDDMFLFGVCLARVGIKPTHSPLFHQARPVDYAMAYLAAQEPVSFHKFWMINPQDVYDEWFAEADSVLPSTIQHTEL